MAIDSTPRFGLPQWSEDTDPITRSQFDDAFLSIDTNVANHPAVNSDDPTSDALKVENEDGSNVLYFSDGSGWYHAATTLAGAPVPFQIIDNTVYTRYYVSETDEWYTVLVTNEASDNIVITVNDNEFTYYNETTDTTYVLPSLPADGPTTIVPLEVNNTGDVPTLDFYDADTEAWYAAGSGGEGGPGVDIRIQLDEPVDPDPGTIWVIPTSV